MTRRSSTTSKDADREVSAENGERNVLLATARTVVAEQKTGRVIGSHVIRRVLPLEFFVFANAPLNNFAHSELCFVKKLWHFLGASAAPQRADHPLPEINYLFSAISGPCWRRATGSMSYGRSA
jgi:hypothetical protein